MRPAISVVMPVYNAEAYVGQAVKSILMQTETDFELIVIDDASTDASVETVNRVADGRVRLLRRQTNGGVAVALNDGLRMAKGRYVARLDADDLAVPERLERQHVWLDAHPRVSVLGTGAIVIDSYGDEAGHVRVASGSRQLGWLLYFGCSLLHPTVMARRDVLEEVGGYREDYPVAQDYDLWLRLTEKFEIDNIPRPYVCLRRHPDSVSHRRVRTQQTLSDRAVVEALARRFGWDVSPSIVAIWRRPDQSPVGGRLVEAAVAMRELVVRHTEAESSVERFATLDGRRRLFAMARYAALRGRWRVGLRIFSLARSIG